MNFIFSWLKFIYIFGAILILLLFSQYSHMQQKSNHASVQSVQVVLKSLNVGLLRNSSIYTINKEATINELILEVVKLQKNHGRDVRISYVFLNQKNQPTEVEEEMVGIQFRVDLLDKKGKIVATSEQRQTLKGDSDE